MAIARCERHRPTGIKRHYTAFASPLGFPDTAIICARDDCEGAAQLWLTERERREHQHGRRIFNIRTDSARVRVGEQLISN